MSLVFINQSPGAGRIPRSALLRAALRAKKLFGSSMRNRTVCVVFVSPAASKKLNTTYRGKHRPTNVLSFVSQNQGELGDILICPAIARREARLCGAGFYEYVACLFVHGLLHLLGFDHQSKKDEQRMEVVAEKILNTK